MWNLIANSSLKRTIFKRECKWRDFPHLQQIKCLKLLGQEHRNMSNLTRMCIFLWDVSSSLEKMTSCLYIVLSNSSNLETH